MKRFSLPFKSLSLLLASQLTFISTGFSLDIRQKQIDDRMAMELLGEGRRAFNNEGQEVQDYNQAIVNQENDVLDLEKMNFSATSQGGDVLNYEGNELSSIKRPDGTILENIVLGADGKIQSADLKLFDGSVQVYENGEVLSYKTPDGTQVFYTAGQISKTISQAGVETLYFYTKNSSNQITQTILKNSNTETTYDAQGKLKEVFHKSIKQRLVYDGGILQSITYADNSKITFKSESVSGSIKVSFKSYVDSSGNSIPDNQLTLPDGSLLKEIVWDAQGNAINAVLTGIDGNAYTFVNKVITSVKLKDNSVLQNISWNAQGSLKDGVLTSSGNKFTYQAGALTTVLLQDNSLLKNIVWDSAGKVQNGLLTDSAGNEHTFTNGALVQIKLKTGSILTNITWTTAGAVQNAVLKDTAGNKFNIVSGVITGIVLTDNSMVTGITWDSAGKIANALLTDPKGNKFNFVNGQLTVISLTDKSVLSNISWTTAGAVQNALLTDTSGNKFTYVNGQITTLALTDGSTLSSLVWDAAGKLQNFIRTDNKGVRWTYVNGQVTQVLLTDGALLQNITWNTDNSIKDALLTATDKSKYTYLNKVLTQSTSPTNVVTTYSYTTDKIIAVTAGVTHEYLLSDKSIAKITRADKSYSLFHTTGTYKGLRSQDVSAAGLVSVYEYQTVSGKVVVQKYDVVASTSNQTTFKAAANIAASSNPALKLNVLIPNNSSSNQKVTASAVLGATKNLAVNLVAGSGSNYVFNGVTKSLGITLNKGVSYNCEMVWGANGINIYVYLASGSKSSAAQAVITDKSWNPLFSVNATNASFTGKILNNLQAPSPDGLKAPALTSRVDTLKTSNFVKKIIAITKPNITVTQKALTLLKPSFSVQKKTLSLTKPIFSVSQKTLNATKADTALGAISFDWILYDAQKNMRQVRQKDGTLLNLENGLLKSGVDPQGNPIAFDFDQSALGNLMGLGIVTNGLESSYDIHGQLSSVKVDDVTIHYLPNTRAIDWVEKTDGTKIKNIVFDTAGSINDALYISPDGTQRTYQAKKMIREKKHDGTETDFTNGKPTVTRMADGRVYVYSPVSVAGNPAAFKGVLTQYVSENGSVIFLANEVPIKIQTKSGMVLTGLKFGADGSLLDATAKFTDSSGSESTLTYQNGEVKQILSSSGSRMFYEKNLLKHAIKANGEETNYSYAYGSDGQISQVILKDALGTRYYHPTPTKASSTENNSVPNPYDNVDLNQPLPELDFLSFFKQTQDATTRLPISHVGMYDSFTVSYTYDVALYILAGAPDAGAILDYFIANPAKTVNSTYVPKGGFYSDLSTLVNQPGFNRMSVVAGPNAWIGLAALKQYEKTKDVRYLNFAKARADFLKALLDPAGGIVMGPQGQSGPPNFASIKSTENNLSAMYLFEALYRATNNAQYLSTADGLWTYVKSLYDSSTHTFSRGESKGSTGWVKDSVSVFATDSLSWMPFERVVNDAFFGENVLYRLQEVESMLHAAQIYTGIFTPAGEIQGFSYSPESKQSGMISIEWTAQMANLYLKVARSYQQLGNDAKYRLYGSYYQKLIVSLQNYFITTTSGASAAPYAVYQDGRGAYGVQTGHGWATPSPVETDVYSLASVYYQFARKKTDPLTLASTPLLSAKFIRQEDVDQYFGKPLPQAVSDVSTSLERYETEDFTAVYSNGALESIRSGNVLIKNPVIDTLGFLVAGVIEAPNGQIYTLSNRKIVAIKKQDGTLLQYDGDFITDVTTAAGKKVHYTYTTNAQDELTNVQVKYDIGNGWVTVPLWQYLFDPKNTEEKPLVQTPYRLDGNPLKRGDAFVKNPATNQIEAGGSAGYGTAADPEAQLIYDSSQFASRGNRTGVDARIFYSSAPFAVQDDSFLVLRLKGTNFPSNVKLIPYFVTTNGQQYNVPLKSEGFTLSTNYQDFIIPVNPDSLYEGCEIATLKFDFDKPIADTTQWKISLAELDYIQIKRSEPDDHLKFLNLSQNQMLDILNKPSKNDAMDLLKGQSIIPGFNHQKEAEKALISMELDANYNYLSGKRVDGTVERYTAGKVSQLKKSASEETYQYDSNGQISKVINKDSATGAVKTVTLYQYGRIRRVENGIGKLLYTYSYETDASQKETTLIKDEATAETKRYQDGKLVRMDNADGTQTLYFYEKGDDRISRSTVMNNNNAMQEFWYSHEGSNTLIKDRDGLTKVYDTSNKLLALLTKNGLEYHYRQLKDEDGNAVEEQFLYSAKTSEGITLFYKDDTVEKIQLKDGTTINIADADQGLYKKILIKQGEVDQIIHQTGEVATYIRDGNGKLKEVRVVKAGQNYRYTPEGRLISRTDTGGVTYHYGYVLDTAGNISKVRVVKRAPKTIGGAVPVIDSETGDFPRFSVLSAGYVDGWNAALFSNDEGVGHFETNYWQNPELKWTGRGYDIAVLDAKGNVIQSDLFDVWGKKAQEAERMADFIEKIPAGSYVLMAVGDDGRQHMTERAYQAIESLGSAQIRNLAFRSSWGLIGKKGIAKGTAIEGIAPMEGGFVSLQSYTTEYSYYDKNGAPIAYNQFANTLSADWTSDYQTHVGDSAEVLKSAQYGYAVAYRKNYNELHPDSGFVQLWNPQGISGSSSVAAYSQEILKLVPAAADKYVFYDKRYPSNYIDPAFAGDLKNILVGKGFQVVDADGLAELMKTGGLNDAVISLHDIMPDTVYNPESPFSISRRKLARTFMDNGGTLLWMGDAPFYYSGHADGTKTTIGEIGAKTILGVTPITRNFKDKVSRVLTENFSGPAFPDNWGYNGNAILKDGYLRLFSSSSAAPVSANEHFFSLSQDYMRYTMDFKNNTLNSGFEAYLDFQSYALYQSIGVRQEGGVLKFFGREPQVGGKFKTTYLGQTAYTNGMEYRVTFEIEKGNLKVFIYPKNQNKPAQPNLTIQNVSASGGVKAGFSIGQGEALVNAVERVTRQIEGVSPDAQTVTPNLGLKAAQSLNASILYFDTNVNFRTVRWDKVQESIGYSLEANTAVISDYDKNGNLISIVKADKTVTVYDENKKVQFITDINGYELVNYKYDSAGNLLSIHNVGERKQVDDALLDMRLRAAKEKAIALEDIAIQKKLAADYRQQVAESRAMLDQARAQAQAALTELEGHNPKSKKDRKKVSEAVESARQAVRDIDRQRTLYEEQVSVVLAQIPTDQEIDKKKAELESQFAKAFSEMDAKAAELKTTIQKEEIKPVVIEHYRQILGRDPTIAEVNTYASQALANGGVLNVTALSQTLKNSSEFIARTQTKDRIRSDVSAKLNAYLAGSETVRKTFLVTLGLTPDQVVTLSSSDIQKIQNYLASQSLHFAESAINSLQALLVSKGVQVNRDEVAAKLILIDVFIGILHPHFQDKEELLISFYAMKKTAALYGVNAEALNLSYDDLLTAYAGNPNMRLVIHISDVHYSIVKSVTATEVRLLETNGDEVVLSKSDFLKAWKGTSLTFDTQLIQKNPAKVISVQDAQRIKGGCFFLIPFFVSVIGAIASAIGGILAVVGALIAQVGALVGQVLAFVGQAFTGILNFAGNFLQGLFVGIKNVGLALFKGFTGFFSTALPKSFTALGVKASLGQTIFNSAIKIGASYFVSKGLDALGVNPVVSSILASFVTGGIHGGFTSQGFNFGFSLAEGLKNGLQIGAQTLLQSAGLNSQLTGILSLTAGPLSNGIWSGNIGGELLKIAPQLSQNLAFYGIERLGSIIGLDPRMTSLIGMPIANGISGFIGGANTGQNLMRSINEGLIRGAIAYGIDFASKHITDNGILQALSSRVIAGAVEGMILQGGDIFRGVYESLKQSVLGAIGVGVDTHHFISNAIDFSGLVLQRGFSSALEIHLTNIFNSNTVESIYRSGGVASALLSPKQNVTLPDGTQARQSILSTGEGILFDANNNLMGFQRQGLYQTGKFGIGNNGSFGLMTGKSFGILQTGQYYEALIKDGKVTQITTITNNIHLEINSHGENSEIRFDVDGNITDGQMMLEDEVALTIANGTLDGINFIVGAAEVPINAVKDLAQKYNNVIDETFLKNPNTDIIYKGDMVAADMKLDWIGDMDTMLRDVAIARAFFWIPANIRWVKAITNAVPKIVDLMKAGSNKFIFTPGVNSGIKSNEHPDYRSMDEIEFLKNSFDLSDKRLMFAHSAGTEAQLKAILKAKQDGVDLSQFKFVFASPRVSRETFVKYLNDAGVTPDQVLVVTAQTDYPHFATDKFTSNPDWSDLQSFFPPLRDYENSSGRYQYVFLEKDLTFDADKAHEKNRVFHGGPVDGAIEDHEYQLTKNGLRIARVRLRDLYISFSNGTF